MMRSVRFRLAVVLLAAAVILGIRNISAKPESTGKIIPVSQRTTDEPKLNVVYEPHEDYTHEAETVSAAVSETCEETPIIEYDASTPYISESKINDIRRKMNEVSKYSKDLIGWIYIADSDIDYPVVQGTDNQYYLSHSPDGRQNKLGTVFLDSKCKSDFSDTQNILFGHNMQYGMFGDIRAYKDKANFDAHRYGWLFSGESLYRIDFYALTIVSAFHKIYDIPANNADWQKYVWDNSLHYTEKEFAEEDRFIALSTCATDFENARALFIGRLTVQE
jgi:SrtB family sortase